MPALAASLAHVACLCGAAFVFCLDIVFGFITGFVIVHNMKRRVLQRPDLIAKYYIFHSTFIVDMLTVLPAIAEVGTPCLIRLIAPASSMGHKVHRSCMPCQRHGAADAEPEHVHMLHLPWLLAWCPRSILHSLAASKPYWLAGAADCGAGIPWPRGQHRCQVHYLTAPVSHGPRLQARPGGWQRAPASHVSLRIRPCTSCGCTCLSGTRAQSWRHPQWESRSA